MMETIWKARRRRVVLIFIFRFGVFNSGFLASSLAENLYGMKCGLKDTHKEIFSVEEAGACHGSKHRYCEVMLVRVTVGASNRVRSRVCRYVRGRN